MRHPPTTDDSFKTVTHARLRAAQGDTDGACRLLCELLRERPDDAEARALLEEIGGAPSRPIPVEEATPLSGPTAGDPAAMAGEFRRALGETSSQPARRIERLEGWLSRIRRG
jgi:hypothetical protein